MTQRSADNSIASDMVGPPQTYLVIADVLQFLGVGVLIDFLLFGGIDIHWLIRCLATALVLWASLRSHAWVPLLAIQTSLLLREPGRPELTIGVESFFMCFSALVILAYACSLPTTRNELRLWLAGGLHTLFGQPTSTATISTEVKSRSSPQIDPGKRIAQLVLWHSAVALVSMLVFVQLPVSRAVRHQWWQRSVDARFTLWPGPVVLTIAVALILFVSLSEWRQITPAQSRLFLRSTFLSNHYRDLKMIVQRRLKTSRTAIAKGIAKPAAIDSVVERI